MSNASSFFGAGTTGPQSALDPAGIDAERLADLFWFMAASGTAIWLITMAVAAAGVLIHAKQMQWAATFMVVAGLIVPTTALALLLVVGLTMTMDLRAGPDTQDIRVTGKQFWWRFHYRQSQTVEGKELSTGEADYVNVPNSLVLPVNVRTSVELRSPDVIHSFWVPALAGKLDLIPGHTNALALLPTRTGEFRGQCAEFCGTSHAYMAFDVDVVGQDKFRDWLAHQARPAREPKSEIEQRGYDVFFHKGCQSCHAIRGTPAAGAIGPDLTHVGGRDTIAAGLFPTNAGTLAGWIAGAQELKPGNKMPSFPTISGPDLRALAHYLASLE